MCKAVEEMLYEKQTEGFIEALAGLVRDGILSIQAAAVRANMSQSEFEDAMKKYAG